MRQLAARTSAKFRRAWHLAAWERSECTTAELRQRWSENALADFLDRRTAVVQSAHDMPDAEPALAFEECEEVVGSQRFFAMRDARRSRSHTDHRNGLGTRAHPVHARNVIMAV